MQQVLVHVTAALAWVLVALPAQAAPVVAEGEATGAYGVAALQAQLDGQHRYALHVDGQEGATFSANTMVVYVGQSPGAPGGNVAGSFDGVVPYDSELVAPAPSVSYWHYSIVVNPTQPADLVVQVLDLGPR